MKHRILALIGFALGSLGAAYAQHDHGNHRPTVVAQSADMADGEVRRVDKDAKKITLRHGEIKSLDMPPMTMVFQVSNPALLDKVQVGDKVRFKAEKAGGAYTITEIQAVK
jgi:Cu/Ag efflux protein CusF